MSRYVELRRHTDNDGDELTEEGVRAALDVGRGLVGGYELLVSSGAQRATQTLARGVRAGRERGSRGVAGGRSRAGARGLRRSRGRAAPRVGAPPRGRARARG